MQSPPHPERAKTASTGAVVVFALLSVLGVFYAKWDPYFIKLFSVAAHHSLGTSIISGAHRGAPPASLQAAWSYAVAYFKDIWIALVVGLVMGAGVQTLLPETWLVNVLGRAGLKSAGLAAVAAVPSMMCTCCSAPIAVSLKKKEASTGAVFAYWLGNPLLNPATIVFMGFVLGWNWALLRIVMGAALVAGAVYIGNRWGTAVPSGLMRPLPDSQSHQGSLVARFLASLAKLSVSLLPEYIVIVGILGAVRSWLFPAMNPAIGHSLWLMLALAVAGTLFVIPTAGEIPIVATLMSYGLGLGAAGTLMITLPAISLPSMAMVAQAVPKADLMRLAGWVAVVGLATGVVAAILL
ncbi:MAG: permease [Thermaerobacter sp.]|nr:permease [Thermaerobacter sp.]